MRYSYYRVGIVFTCKKTRTFVFEAGQRFTVGNQMMSTTATRTLSDLIEEEIYVK